MQFLRHVVRSRSFAQADLDTALIQREAAVLFNQQPVGLAMAAACAVAAALVQERAAEGSDPYSRRDGWRPYGVATRAFAFEFGGERVDAQLTYLHDGALQLKVGETSGPLAFAPSPSGGGQGRGLSSTASSHTLTVDFAGRRVTADVYANGETDHVFTPAGATQILSIDLLAHAGEGGGEGGRLTAPMPGKVISFAVKAGDAVKKGQALAVMEAMKMEHTIAAPSDGTVAEVLYAPGDQVAEGAELLKMA